VSSLFAATLVWRTEEAHLVHRIPWEVSSVRGAMPSLRSVYVGSARLAQCAVRSGVGIGRSRTGERRHEWWMEESGLVPLSHFTVSQHGLEFVTHFRRNVH
jgi:hypothetical protein